MGQTIVDTFFCTAVRLQQKVALRTLRGDAWEEISWDAYAAAVRRAAAGFLALGIKPADRIGIFSHNSPEWLYADLGALTAGGVTVAIYPTLVTPQVQHIVQHSQMRVMVVENAALRDKVQALRGQCPHLEHIIVLHGEAGDGALGWDSLLQKGDAYLAADSQAIIHTQRCISPDKLATIVYTSGTTGPPKGAMLSHRNMIFEAQQIAQLYDLNSSDETLSFLPLSHVAERLQGEVMAVAAGMTVNFGAGIDAVRQDMLRVRPTLVVCVPRLWEKMHEGIQGEVHKMPQRRRGLFDWAIKAGERSWQAQWAGQPLGVGAKLQAFVADELVARPLRARLGLDRARLLMSGAAPLSSRVQLFFAGLGLPVMEAYGQSECMGISHCSPSPQKIRPNTVGMPLPDITVRIAADGEICVRGDNVFMGYFNDEAATQEALQDGWLHTGDVGRIDADGALSITDRKKDIIVTAGGKNVAPQNIENRLKSQPGINQAVVLGDKRKYLVALVTVDAAAMNASLGVPLHEPASRSDAVRRHVQDAIARVNSELSSYETVKRFEILDKDFSVEGGELTPTLKVKRRVIHSNYGKVIDGLYANA